MFDKFRLKDALARYKQNFVSTQWGNEKYKWEAVKWFQDNWDVNAKDFPEMLERSLAKTYNLLASNNNFPKGMIIGFAKAAPEEVRAMFLDLFDENKDVFERMNAFKLQSSILLEKYGNGAAQHYQYENAISTYLWLRYPNKYYIYKFGEIKKVAGELESDYQFKKGAYADNIRNFLRLYDEISTALKEDTELVNLLRSQLTDTCYPDPELKTLTIDVGFYISRYIVDEKSEESTGEKDTAADSDSAAKKRYWIYSPGDGAENWDEFYNAGIMAIGWEALGNLHAFHSKDEMAKKMQEIFSDDSSHKNDAHATWQFANEINPGDIVFAKKGLRLLVGCGVVESDYIFDEHEEHFKNVRKVRWTHKGEWQYPGNAPMKTLTDLTPYPDVVRRLLNLIDELPDEPVSEDKDAPGYWWLNANPKIWSFSGIAVGETQSYTLYNENGNKRRIFQNFLDAKAGDMIIGYESNPVKQVVALGQITAANDGEKILFEKVESFASPIDYAVLKACPELEQMNCKRNVKPEMAELKGKRLIIASELEEGTRLNTGMVKQLCSVDPIEAEKKYKDPFHFDPSHTLVLYTNHLPKVSANDDGTWRRLIVIPFNAKITGKSDIKNFSDYLFEHAGSAIMKWIIEGAELAINKGFKFTEPQVVVDAINEYRENNDWLGQFIEEHCDVDPSYSEKSGELYQQYRVSCIQCGEFVRSTSDFYGSLEKAGFFRYRKKSGRVIVGLKLKDGQDFLE